MTKVRYVVGKIVLWALAPIWILMCIFWWKQDSLFMMRLVNHALTGKDEY